MKIKLLVNVQVHKAGDIVDAAVSYNKTQVLSIRDLVGQDLARIEFK